MASQTARRIAGPAPAVALASSTTAAVPAAVLAGAGLAVLSDPAVAEDLASRCACTKPTPPPAAPFPPGTQRHSGRGRHPDRRNAPEASTQCPDAIIIP